LTVGRPRHRNVGDQTVSESPALPPPARPVLKKFFLPQKPRSAPITAPFVLSLLLCAAPSQPQEPAVAPQPPIRITVERVNVGVIVTDNRGKLVEGLSRENFLVTDNGAAQPITDFVSIDQPAQVLMLVEAGPAVYLLQAAHLFVADTLLGGLSPGDRVALVRYNEAPLGLLDFTTDKRMAQSALDQIQFNLGYGQLNLSSSLNTVLDWLARVPGKKTVLLISTGVDTSPEPVMQALLGRLQVADVRTLCISMSGPLRDGKEGSKQQAQQTQAAFAQADRWLKLLAEASGGHAYFPANAKEFQEAYRQIAQLVRHEYSLAFTPPVADGAVHTIDVRVCGLKEDGKDKASDLIVDHRKAYVAPKPPAGP
jgi:VWFA-related protein